MVTGQLIEDSSTLSRGAVPFGNGLYGGFTKTCGLGIGFLHTRYAKAREQAATVISHETAFWSFSADPAWHELSRRPGNTDAEIVSNISNLYLSPLSCSQI
jgi:hypothetical protein